MGTLGTILCKSLVLKTQTYSFNKSLVGSLETPIELLFFLRGTNWPNALEESRVEYIIMERWLSGNLVTGLTSFSFSSSYLTKIHWPVIFYWVTRPFVRIEICSLWLNTWNAPGRSRGPQLPSGWEPRYYLWSVLHSLFIHLYLTEYSLSQ